MNGFDIIFTAFSILFIITFVYTIFKSIVSTKKNSELPRLTVEAILISKKEDYEQTRTPVNGDITGASGYHTHGSYTYYATFQVESGDLIRFCISEDVYNTLFDGDTGRLSLQGNRFLGFEQCKIDTSRFRANSNYQ